MQSIDSKDFDSISILWGRELEVSVARCATIVSNSHRVRLRHLALLSPKSFKKSHIHLLFIRISALLRYFQGKHSPIPLIFRLPQRNRCRQKWTKCTEMYFLRNPHVSPSESPRLMMEPGAGGVIVAGSCMQEGKYMA